MFMPRHLVRSLLALVVLAFAAGAAHAQQSVGRIVASVNDAAITDFDLEARARLLALSTRADPSPDLQQRIARQALRELIDDRLKVQEAERLGITVSDQEVSGAIGTIERNNNMQPGGLMQQLTAANVPAGTLIDQVKATLLWRKVLRRRVLPQVRVASEEVDSALARIREAGGGELMRAAEIFIPDDVAGGRQAALAQAAAIRDEAVDSGAFARLAATNSRAPTAAVGGDLGDIQPGQLDPALEDALAALQPGQTSPPIETARGVYLMHLIERRSIQAGDAAQAVVTLSRIFLPVEGGETNETVGQRLKSTVAGVDGCDAFDRAAQRLGTNQPPRVVDARIGDLPEELRSVVDALKPGEQTEPLPLANGVAILMLCRRAEVGDGLPSAQRVADAIQQQRAERRAERYLRDLRRLAFIDIRG